MKDSPLESYYLIIEDDFLLRSLILLYLSWQSNVYKSMSFDMHGLELAIHIAYCIKPNC